MARQDSGIFTRDDRVRASAKTNVRLVRGGREGESRATLLELGKDEVLLSETTPPALGTRLGVAITLPGRYVEFELPGTVSWRLGEEFVVSFDDLSARQAYGLTLAMDLMRAVKQPATAALNAARR